MNEDIPTFESTEEEMQYFKSLAAEYKKKWQESQQELEEFQESSRELEVELEAQLEQMETQSRELRSINTRLQMEYDSIKEKLDISHQEGYRQVNNLQQEVSTLKTEKEDLMKYIRKIEQANDDLERGKRATVSSLEDFETKLNFAIERNAFLESELDEKETLAAMVQRLKDEARDLRQELLIHQNLNKQINNDTICFDNDRKVKKTIIEVDSNKLTTENETQTTSPMKVLQSTGHTPLTPSARISALNIVGDLLRKVGALELKLASCRTLVREPLPILDNENCFSPTSPSKVQQLTRGSSLSGHSDCIHLIAS